MKRTRKLLLLLQKNLIFLFKLIKIKLLHSLKKIYGISTSSFEP